MTWRDRARERLAALSMSYGDLSRPLGVGAAAVGHYFTGRSDPSPDQLVALCGHLRCSLDWLLTGAEIAPDVIHYGQMVASLSQGDRLLILELLKRLEQ